SRSTCGVQLELDSVTVAVDDRLNSRGAIVFEGELLTELIASSRDGAGVVVAQRHAQLRTLVRGEPAFRGVQPVAWHAIERHVAHETCQGIVLEPLARTGGVVDVMQ